MAKILVTDDAAFMRMMLKGILTKYGHVIEEAVNGRDMIDKYKSFQPDVVTLDITMPVMDGLEGIKELKKLYPSAKVIMCSAMGQQAMVIEAIQSGASDFIVKPFEPDRVMAAINKVLNA